MHIIDYIFYTVICKKISLKYFKLKQIIIIISKGAALGVPSLMVRVLEKYNVDVLQNLFLWRLRSDLAHLLLYLKNDHFRNPPQSFMCKKLNKKWVHRHFRTMKIKCFKKNIITADFDKLFYFKRSVVDWLALTDFSREKYSITWFRVFSTKILRNFSVRAASVSCYTFFCAALFISSLEMLIPCPASRWLEGASPGRRMPPTRTLTTCSSFSSSATAQSARRPFSSGMSSACYC